MKGNTGMRIAFWLVCRLLATFRKHIRTSLYLSENLVVLELLVRRAIIIFAICSTALKRRVGVGHITNLEVIQVGMPRCLTPNLLPMKAFRVVMKPPDSCCWLIFMPGIIFLQTS